VGVTRSNARNLGRISLHCGTNLPSSLFTALTPAKLQIITQKEAEPMTNRFAAIMLLAGTASLAACSKKAPEELPPPPSGTGIGTQGTGTTSTQPIGPSVGSQRHFENAVNGQNVIYFDTDRFNIDSVDAGALQAQAQYMGQYSGVSITIEGHADERGTREYNLALGERRANAAKNYLVSLGVAANRISTVSYGKERPEALGSDPESWALNRRAVSVVVN
jgi:peptidoglycan-associated lipoprotein